MRTFALSFTLALAATALADTTWTNPDGGLWTDPGNWSDGLPTGTTVVLLPPLDEDGYTIALPVGATAKDVLVGSAAPGATVTLTGGSIGIAGLLRIGGAGESGALNVAGGQVNAGAIAIGADDGSGALVVSGSGTVVALSIAVGQSGIGSVEVKDSLLVASMSLQLFAGSTLMLWAKPEANPIVLAGAMQRGGALVVVAAPDMSLPSPTVQLTSAASAMTGGFASITGPIVKGYEAPIQMGPSWIVATGIDPVASMDVSFPNGPVFVGFGQPVAVHGTRHSGQVDNLCDCCGTCGNVTFATSDPDSAVVEAATLFSMASTPSDLTATYEEYGVTIATTVGVVPTDDYPVTYTSVATTVAGDAADSPSVTVAGAPRWTPDGRFVVFASHATNLAPPDLEPDQPNLFVKDLWTGAIEQVDVDASFGEVVSHDDWDYDISDDGRYIAFTRDAAVKGAATASQVWLRDRFEGTTSLVSVAESGDPADASCVEPRIAGDGTVVVYRTQATNLVSGVSGTAAMIIATEMGTGDHELASATAGGEPANSHCGHPSISGDGSAIAFDTKATNLVPGTTGTRHVVVLETSTWTFARVDVGETGEGGDLSSSRPDLSHDGRFVAFESNATNLGAPPDGDSSDVFVRDRVARSTTFVSPDLPGFPSVVDYRLPSVSDDGSYAAFVGLPPAPSYDEGYQLRRVHRTSLASDIIAVDPWMQPLAVWVSTPALSADGGSVLFTASSSQLVPFGFSALVGPFVRDFTEGRAADLNRDGIVGPADLAFLLGAWGTSGPGDLDGDGAVSADDLALLLGAWTA